MSFPTNKQGINGGRFYSFLNRPVLVDCSFIVDPANGNGLGLRSLKGSGVQAAYMYTSATPATGNPLGHTASEGYILIQLANNYNRYAGGFSGFVSPPNTGGGALAINGSALTVGSAYTIASVGHGSAGAVTIAPVADSSGSLASTYFTLFDGWGNTFTVWFYVTGVGGTAPQVGGTLVQQTIAENATADNITTALAATLALLPAGPTSTYSFTTSGGGSATLTATSTQTNPYAPIPAPMDGAIATGFTFATTVTHDNGYCWRQVGLPNGVTPNVSAAFIATATGFSSSGASTGTVYPASVSGTSNIEVIGDVNQTLSPTPRGPSANVGGWLLLQCLSPVTTTGTTAMTLTQPATNSVVGLSFYVEAGSILIDGE